MITRTAGRPLGALGRMGMVAAIHVAVLFAIMRSLGIGSVPVEERMTATIEKVVRPPDDPTPPPPDFPVVTSRSVVLPEVPVDTLQFEPLDTISEPPPEVDFTERTGGDNTPQPVIESVRQDPRYPLSRPAYSARMIREGNQGTIDLEVYVQPNGRVADARVVRSTGFEELDRAALAEAKRNWRLLPAKRDGVPIAQWHRLRVTFKLNQQ
jgi:periplasmic protein TonB